MAKPKLVIFDLDNTLINTRPAAKIGYKQAIYYIAKRHGIYNKRDKLYNHWKRIVQHLMGEKKPHLRRFEYSLRELLRQQKIPETYLPQALHTYEKYLLQNLKILPGANELLSWLKDNDHIITIATGSDPSEAKKKLKKVRLFQYLDNIITATDVGFMKPDSQYFQLAIKDSGITPKYTLVVGDSQTEDIDPAKSLGLKTYLVPFSSFHLGKVKEELSDWFQNSD